MDFIGELHWTAHLKTAAQKDKETEEIFLNVETRKRKMRNSNISMN